MSSESLKDTGLSIRENTNAKSANIDPEITSETQEIWKTTVLSSEVM